VKVLSAPEQIVRLIQLLKGSSLPPSLETRLVVTLEHVLSAEKAHVACGALDRFIDALESTPGTQISADVATGLMADARRIGAVMACPSD
jgi:hypothetical protein